MDQAMERFFKGAYRDPLSRLGQESQEIKGANLDLWRIIITIQATILGITIALMGYVEVGPTPLLTTSWMLEIGTIALGLLLFKIHIDKELRASYQRFKAAIDFTELYLLDTKGEFNGNLDKKIGLVVAAVMYDIADFPREILTEYGKVLAQKHKDELPSAKLIQESAIKKSARLGAIPLKSQVALVDAFYALAAISFLTLLLSVLIR